MPRISTTLALLEHEISELRLILERQAGVLLDTPSDLLGDYVSQYIESHRLSGIAELMERLRSSDSECESFLEPLLDGTTRFFAHPEAFDSLTHVALPQLMRQNSSQDGSRTLRVWSAGCGTGEEAYSIAISLCEAMHRGNQDWNIRIVGSDIRRDSLKTAERGLYLESALSQLPQTMLQSYFARVGKHFLIKPRIRNLACFTVMNLAKTSYIGRFHCIFCMDVLPRFSKGQRVALLQRLHLYLEPGGFLFLGEDENLPASSVDFQVERNLNYTLYRKPLASAAASGA